jgi:DNA-binding MarR family transcriptional regulator
MNGDIDGSAYAEPVATDPVLTSAGYLLLKAGVHFHAAMEEGLDRLGLTPRQFLVLTFAVADDDLHQLELSRRLNLDATIVGGLIDDLEGRKLVERRRDPADRRRSLVVPTATGRKLQAKAVAALGSIEADFLAPVPDGEREALRLQLLAIMTDRLPWLG